MGFLDHTTNNVIIDAVLTERGRELLARNDGSFKIDAFSFGDDEVDYSNIVKYGLGTGKEKIEKNTPIFEAQTNENFGLKYNNFTLANPRGRILFVPILQKYKMSDINLVVNNTVSQTVRVISTILDKQQSGIDANLADKFFQIRMNSLLLGVTTSQGFDKIYDDDENFIRTYKKSGTLANVLDGQTVENRYLLDFNISIVNLTEQAFEKFGIITKDQNGIITSGIIDTYIEIVGMSSGARIIIPVKITLNNV